MLYYNFSSDLFKQYYGKFVVLFNAYLKMNKETSKTHEDISASEGCPTLSAADFFKKKTSPIRMERDEPEWII